MNIYVGNLNFQTPEEKVEELFRPYGELKSVKLIRDTMTNRSRGFAFIEMPNDDEANQAIESLNGQTVDDKVLVVNESRPKTFDKRGGGGGGNRGYNGGGGGYNKRY